MLISIYTIPIYEYYQFYSIIHKKIDNLESLIHIRYRGIILSAATLFRNPHRYNMANLSTLFIEHASDMQERWNKWRSHHDTLTDDDKLRHSAEMRADRTMCSFIGSMSTFKMMSILKEKDIASIPRVKGYRHVRRAGRTQVVSIPVTRKEAWKMGMKQALRDVARCYGWNHPDCQPEDLVSIFWAIFQQKYLKPWERGVEETHNYKTVISDSVHLVADHEPEPEPELEPEPKPEPEVKATSASTSDPDAPVAEPKPWPKWTKISVQDILGSSCMFKFSGRDDELGVTEYVLNENVTVRPAAGPSRDDSDDDVDAESMPDLVTVEDDESMPDLERVDDAWVDDQSEVSGSGWGWGERRTYIPATSPFYNKEPELAIAMARGLVSPQGFRHTLDILKTAETMRRRELFHMNTLVDKYHEAKSIAADRLARWEIDAQEFLDIIIEINCVVIPPC